MPSESIQSDAKACAAVHARTVMARPALSAATRSFSCVLFIVPRARLLALWNQRPDQLSLDSCLAECKRHGFVTLHAAGDLAIDPIVQTQFDVHQMDSIILHYWDIDPFAVKDQCL